MPFRRRIVFIGVIIASWAVAVVVPGASLAQNRASSVARCPADTLKTGYAGLTVEGGGTLGAYEGGLTWALLETFRQRRLMRLPDSVMSDASKPAAGEAIDAAALCAIPYLEFRASAGASAGSINAFIAANRWCSIDPAESDQNSSFWKVWVLIGLSNILPRRRDPEWGGDKAVFTRTQLNPVFTKLDSAWSTLHYAPGCKVSFGATITRLAADSLILSDRIQPRNQRYASAFAVESPPTGSGALVYRHPSPDPASRMRLGALLELPLEESGGTIRHRFAQKLINASSGYPLAFQPELVHYCAVPNPLEPDTTLSQRNAMRDAPCTESRADSAYFIDGGVFDNSPLTLSYGLSLAADSSIHLGNLNMLFVSPGQRRYTGDRRDAFSSTREGLSSGATDTTRKVAEAPSEGLDALSKLIATFIPSARHYELQIAARVLPGIQAAELRQGMADTAVLIANLERYLVAKQRQVDSLLASIAMNAIRRERDSLRYRLAGCRLTPGSCVASSQDSALVMWPQRWNAFDTVPVAGSGQAARGESGGAAASTVPGFHRLLHTSTRWHPLAGEWLFGFGGFIGRPLREYDFYVGVYDAFALITEQISCRGSKDPTCFRTTLHRLIEKPLVPLSVKGRVVLAALYKEEFPAAPGEEPFSIRADTTNDLLLHIVKAMGARMSETRLPATACREGGRLERLSCNEGIDTVFTILRKTVDIEGKTPPNCADDAGKVGECPRDKRFADFVHDPNVALNKLTGDVLERLLAATPDSSGLKFPLTVATAMYFSTNERGRTGVDAGSVSLPSLPVKGLVLFLATPSSVGGFAGYRGWYLEWAARWHVSPSYTLGVAARPVWASKFASEIRPHYGRLFIPALRAEIKPWGWLTPWVSTAGIDLAYWSDESPQVFWRNWDKNGLTFAVTSALFMQRARVSVYRRPGKYRMRSGERPATIVSIGLGDTNGALYWLFRALR